MYPPELEHMAFITPMGMYFYNVMPFGLKNVGATYQRMMSRIFEPRLGNTLDAYIDDMLVKSMLREDHLAHLRSVFELMRKHWLRSNLEKCAFGVGFGNFLGFLVSQRGIEIAPRHFKAIT